MLIKYRLIVVALVSALLTACGGGGGGGGASPSGSGTVIGTTSVASAPQASVGLFIDAPTAGLSYNCGGTTGVTNASGQFNYTPGSTCTFSVGNVTVGSLGTIPSDGVVTPQDAAGVSRTFTTAPGVQVIAQFLQSIGSSTAGTLTISSAMSQALANAPSTNLTGSSGVVSQSDLTHIVTNIAGKQLITPQAASATLASQLQTAGVNMAAGAVTDQTPAKLSDIVVSAAVTSNAVGLSEQLKASGDYSDGTTTNMTQSVTWSSSNTGIISVNQSGLATGVAPGTATVSATSNNGVIGSIALTVNPANLVSLAISPANSSMPIGLTQQMTVTGTYSDGTIKPISSGVTLSSSSSWVSLSGTGVAIGRSVGTSTITASYGGITTSTILNISPAVLKSISILTPNSVASAPIGLGEQLVALGTYSDGTTANLNNLVTWKSNSTSVAVVNSGLMAGVSIGNALITASYPGWGGTVTGTLTIPITSAALQSISISAQTSTNAPTASSAPKGFSQNLIATGTYSDGSTQVITNSVTWSSAKQSIATVSTGALGGAVTGISTGSTSITASLAGVSSQVGFSVTAPVLVSLAVASNSSSVSIGSLDSLVATGTYSDGSTQNLTSQVQWSVDNSNLGSISNGGMLTGLAVGNPIITASLNGVSSPTVSVSITPRVGQFVDAPVSGLTYTCGPYSGTTNALGQFNYSSSASCTFSVGNVTVGTLPFIPSDGIVTPQDVAGVSRTTTTDPNVQVIAQFLQSIGVQSASGIGISTNVTQAFALVQAQSLITSSGPISQTALKTLVTASSPNLNLTSPATASSILASQIQAAGINTAIGVVSSLKVDAVTVTSPSSSLSAGQSVQLNANGNFTDGSTSNLINSVTWTSSNTAILTVSPSGVAKGISSGNATISATSAGLVSSVTITVTPATLVSVKVTPVSSTLSKGLTQQMTALGSYSDGSTAVIPSGVSWSSSSNAATVSSLGVVQGISSGAATISASVGSVTGSTSITITAAELKTISVTAFSANTPVSTLPIQTSQQLVALGTYSDNTTANLSNLVTWSSSNANASVTPTGILNGIANGSVSINAVYQGVTGTVTGTGTFTLATMQLNSVAITALINTNAVTASSSPAGYGQQLIATGNYSFNGNTLQIDITKSVAWTSTIGGVANQSVASVSSGNSGGWVTAVATGQSNITASLNGVSNSVSFTVTPPVLLSIAINGPQNGTTEHIGASENLSAVGTYSDGSSSTITSGVTWSSSGSSASLTTSNGVAQVKGLSSGAFNITAAYPGVSSASYSVNVIPPPYSVGGTIVGLASNRSITVLNNAGDTLILSSNGTFNFATPVNSGASYAVSIGTQPTNQSCVTLNSSGNSTTNITNVVISCTTNQYTVSTLVNNLFIPAGVTTDALGNLYLGANVSQVDKITPAGVVTTIAGSGSLQGFQDGTANGANSPVRFKETDDVAVDALGNLYVADRTNNTIRKITVTNSIYPSVSTYAGPNSSVSVNTAGYVDSTSANARFNSPTYLTIDQSGNLYVSDTGNNVIRKIDTNGNVSTLAGSGRVGSSDGTGTNASFSTPMGITIDASGNLYVADNQNCLIRKITQSGVVSTVAGNGNCSSADGVGNSASFNKPQALAIDSTGTIYVVDTVQTKIRKITPAGVVVTIAGTGAQGSADGPGSDATFGEFPRGIAVDTVGNVYLSDTGNSKIRKLMPGN